MSRNSVSAGTLKTQQGFLIPLSVILIVGIGVLALTISRVSSQSNSSSVLEGISLQTFYAAESGAQYGLHQLFFSNTTRADADATCTGVGSPFPNTINFTADGLQLCSTTVSCSFTTDTPATTSFYTIVSAASCGAGDIVAERTVEVRAFM